VGVSNSLILELGTLNFGDSAVEKGGYWNLFKNFPKLADNCRIEFKETKNQILHFCSCHRIDF
jgi:hypothetical protein